MERNFDELINRKNTKSLKYDFAVERGMAEDLLPMWVADMDFQAPRAVVEKLEQVSRFGIYGYSEVKEEYFQVVADWYQRYFDWQVEPEWLVKTPGVVFGIAMAIRALTQKGEGVIIQPPVYYPFRNTILLNERKLVTNPLILNDGSYHMDLVDFEQKIIENEVKLFILCSPHNPIGRVWTKQELMAVGEICLKYGVAVISDEIHGDFVWPGHQQTVFAKLSEELANISIICTSPSKTFNLAGLQVSNFFIPNQKIRKKFILEMSRVGYDQLNLMGLTACEAAYRDGHTWLTELKDYLRENINFVRSYLTEHLPEIELIEPQGTYLLWLNLKKLELSEPAKKELMIKHAKLWLDAGTMFGEEGIGFERINIACPKAVIEQAMTQLKQAVEQNRGGVKDERSI